MYFDRAIAEPPFTIDSPRLSSALLVIFAILATAIPPLEANAFWPFNNADAASSGTIPDATTPALVAVTNENANAPAAAPLPTSGDTALVPYQGPDGSPGDGIVTPATDKIANYLVKPGDTLSEIAATYGVSVNTIIWANDLKSATDVHPGDSLIILPVSGISHTVAKGDTLASLAKKYSADAGEIASYNGLASGAALAIGTTVIIPDGELQTAAPSSHPSSKKSGGSAKLKPAKGTTNPYRGGSGPAEPGYFAWPVAGGAGVITQGLHGWNAVDIGMDGGDSVVAAAAGTVLIARDNGGWNGGYGNYVVIAHPNGTETLYAHMVTGSLRVSPGESVDQGQALGIVGRTGDATGNHVHFEVRGAKNPFAN